MPPNSSTPNASRFPEFDHLPPIDPDEFATAFNWAMNAASGRAIIADPSDLRLGFRGIDGGIHEIRFTDTVLARITIAMKERYGDNTEKYVSASGRIFALLRLLQSGELSDWIRPDPSDPGNYEIHPSLVEAASNVRLTRNCTFPRDEFLRTVEQLASQDDRQVG